MIKSLKKISFFFSLKKIVIFLRILTRLSNDLTENSNRLVKLKEKKRKKERKKDEYTKLRVFEV
jgi:hypothetical protein